MNLLYDIMNLQMIEKYKVIKEILDVGVVAIIRVENAENAKMYVEACVKGGLKSVEITFTVANAHKIIESIANKELDCNLGAGTVLDSETARIAILAGAKYIVSPFFDKATAKLCNRYAVPYMAGCYTPADIVLAMEYGVDIVKLFPSVTFGPSIVKALKAPLPQANIMPTGGVNINNASEWIRAGAVALGIGGDLTRIKEGEDVSVITEKAKKYVQIVSDARKI